MQGKNENLFSSTDKLRALQEKLKVWSLQIQKGTFDSFVISQKHIKNNSLVIQHLKSLQEKINNYFPTVSITNYIWFKKSIFTPGYSLH